MAHDVFISHSSRDKTVADATCAWLETHGIRCWVAPRDIQPGASWGASIIKAIHESRIVILIFSSHANASPQIKREVERAVHAGATIIPMRIEDVLPQDDLEYFLGTPHWLDAFAPPLELHLERLAAAIRDILKISAPAPIPGQEAPPATSPSPLRKPPSFDKKWLIGGAIALLIVAGLAYFLRVEWSAERLKQAGWMTATGPVAGHEWTNSLGMKFVPAGTDGVLFCIWDVRKQDFQAFVQATGYQMTGGIYVMKGTAAADGSTSLDWVLDPKASWEHPGYDQTPTHPVVGVSWYDAKAFCRWLTKEEQAEGKLAAKQQYRLPTDAEWTRAAGSGKYVWGDAWPPPDGAGNYGDQAFAATLPGSGWQVVPQNDGYARTSPVGNFQPNQYGLYDMGGNVWQRCEDWYQSSMNSDALRRKYPGQNNDGGGQTFKVERGGSWNNDDPDNLLSSFRAFNVPDGRDDGVGFRVVLVVAPQPGS